MHLLREHQRQHVAADDGHSSTVVSVYTPPSHPLYHSHRQQVA